MLGLVKEDNRSAIDVNYDLSVAEVYSQAAAKIMQDTGNLHLLTFADPQADETLKLPPWCYDWGTTSYLTQILTAGSSSPLVVVDAQRLNCTLIR